MRISIIGTGYVGLVTGVCLAVKGHDVICVDKKPAVINNINNSISPIYEQKLDGMLKQVVRSKKLIACSDTAYAVEQSEVTIVAVGTPYKGDSIDLSYIEQCIREIGEALANKLDYHLICIKSTVVPGTTDTIVREILEKTSGKAAGEFGLVMNPEFLREGCAVEDFMLPDRIVIGAYDDASYDKMSEIYKGKFDAPIIKVNLRTAEMIKYASNAFLASLISFGNEISNICEAVGGIDAVDVLQGVAEDKRVVIVKDGQRLHPSLVQYLKPGCGFGGSCFPKDVKALIAHSCLNSYKPALLNAVIQINELQPIKVVEKLEQRTGQLEGKKIAVLGIAFKPETDDIRESPAIKIIQMLLEKGAIVTACDPKALNNAEKELSSINLTLTLNYAEALKDADGAILVTPWQQYMNISPAEFKRLMKVALLIDGRRIYDKDEMLKHNVQFAAIGLEK